MWDDWGKGLESAGSFCNMLWSAILLNEKAFEISACGIASTGVASITLKLVVVTKAAEEGCGKTLSVTPVAGRQHSQVNDDSDK